LPLPLPPSLLFFRPSQSVIPLLALFSGSLLCYSRQSRYISPCSVRYMLEWVFFLVARCFPVGSLSSFANRPFPSSQFSKKSACVFSRGSSHASIFFSRVSEARPTLSRGLYVVVAHRFPLFIVSKTNHFSRPPDQSIQGLSHPPLSSSCYEE